MAIRPETGLYGNLIYNTSADFKSDGDTSKAKGQQIAFGAFQKLSVIEGFPGVVWAEFNMVRESSDVRGNKGELEVNEFGGGVLFRIVKQNQLSVSAGGEFLVSADGDAKDDEGVSLDAEREDILGIKGLATYEIDDQLRLTGQIGFLNETRFAFSVSRDF